MKFVDVKNDVAFRKIFGDEKKTVVLISFLNAVLELEGLDRIRSVKLIDPFQLPRIRGEKASIIDVRAKDHRGRSFIIEMQVAEREGFAKRIQYYSCKEYASQIDKGDEYSELRPVYFIGILNFGFFPGTNYFSKHLIIDEETGICTLDDIKFRFIELTKFKKKENELTTVVDKWTYFIKKAHKLAFVPTDIKDKGLLVAYDLAERHNWSKQEYDAYIYAGMREQDARGRLQLAKRRAKEEGKKEGREEGKKEGREEGKKEGREEGKKEGREEGKEEQKIATILGFYKNNAPVSLIASSLNMTVEEVKEIITRHAKKK